MKFMGLQLQMVMVSNSEVISGKFNTVRICISGNHAQK